MIFCKFYWLIRSTSRCHGHEYFLRAAMSLRGSSAADISAWRSTRPSAPPLSLIVREISSVSATFILSFSIPDASLDIASLVQEAEDDGAGDDDKSSKKHTSFISDILAKGLFSVNVNGAPWQHIFVRVAENGEEAVIIIYGLFPGRQYNIDLGLAQDGQSSTIRSQVTTEGELRRCSILPCLVTICQDQDHLESVDMSVESELAAVDRPNGGPSTDHRRNVSSASTSSSSSFITESESSRTSQSSSPDASPSTSSESPTPNGVTISTEEHVNQLQETLNMLITERDSLTMNLKSARRESQKADAALRAEIESLQRSSEKHGVSEQRTKQKILALQEAHKRAIAAAQEMEEEVRRVEALLPDLVKKEEKERECEKLEAEAANVRKEREQIEETEKKQIESMRAELAVLNHKLEKLGGKKDKLETGTIPDLEMQLRQVVEEIDKMEAEERDLELAYATFSHNQAAADEMGMLRHPDRTASDSAAQQPQQHRGRHHSFHSAPSIGGQSIPSTQRSNTLQAPSTSTTHPNLQHIWNTTPSRQTQVQRQQHTSRFTYPQPTSLSHMRSQPQQPPIILTNPNRKKSASTSSPHSLSSSTSFGASLVSSPSSNSSSSTMSSGSLTSVPEQVSVSSTASTSTLSSRAPVFEPGVGIGLLSKLQRQNYASTGTGSRSNLVSRWKGIGESETTSK